MSSIALGWLAALGLGLVAVLAVEIAPALDLDRAGPVPRKLVPARLATSGKSAAPAPDSGMASAADSADAAAILARPLFNRSRRPDAANTPVVGELRLTGVVVGPAGREAIFQPVAGGKPLVVFEGERVNGALVRVIAPGAVLMIDGRGAHLISPAYAPGGATPMGAMMRRRPLP